MNNSQRKFAIYVKAQKPFTTMRLFFSDKLTEAEATTDALTQFDHHYPTATDRHVHLVQTIADCNHDLDLASQANYEMCR